MADVTIPLRLRPFTTPNFVMAEMPPRPKQEGVKELPSFALHELSVETLDELCGQFRAEVFAKAGKKDPRLVPEVT